MPKSSNTKVQKSPYSSPFKSAVNRGTPCWTAIANISSRTGKSPTVICNSLYSAGLVDRCKFNGQWVYWPTFQGKPNATQKKASQFNLWQSFVDWCFVNQVCTPQQLSHNCSSQKQFMNYCKKFWNKQFTGVVPVSSPSTTSGYNFPHPSTGRKVRKAA